LAGLAALTISSRDLTSAEIKSAVGKNGQVVVAIVGEIVPGDADSFAAAVKQANEAGKLVANVRLNSEGGNLLEGVKLADAIRYGKISTNVGKSATCASACFLAFAAGNTKFASYGAQIGVHGASDQSGNETTQSGAATVSMAKIARDLGVPSAIIGRMVVTPPSEIVWLNPQELQSMGVTMVGKPDQIKLPSADSGAVQQVPGAPTSLAPQVPDAKASTKAPTWDEFVDAVVSTSARQNNGQPRFFRFCQPEQKACITGVSYKDKGGTDMAIKVIKDAKEIVLSREICSFNSSNDVRVCVDWDKGTTRRDMQNVKGEWYKVSDD
jgi:hypothetical protein